MALLTKPFSLLSLSLLFLLSLMVFCHPTTAADTTTTLIFKGCASQKFQDSSQVYSQNLKTLLSSLVSQSSQQTFATTTSGDGQNAIMGLYQCRGDLAVTECNTCVSKISDMVDKLCGKSIAARIQLSGCYLRYEIIGFKQVSETELIYKVCGSTQASGTGFENKRDMAFSVLTNGVKNSGSFYTGKYEEVYVLGQCEGDLASNDCGDCVKSAVERAKDDCGKSIAVQIYLHKCYISYSYYPNGVPNTSSSPLTAGGGTRQHTQKTVAIAVGGIAVLGFGVVLLMFVWSAVKKRGGKQYE
ncbi:plasmodesmata-located protein 1-like [Pistacia vera]|uniref:plasmodesmata-located protein 1-like n=1 Tax=Pistacia vera TaxID=55513 RepID=UPI00126313D5|nr:plasmodesmata-located protein 1-like [Pistacia vera]